VSFDKQGDRDRRLAREALSELNAELPDESPAQLLGGSSAWGESWVASVEAERDPANAPTMRPHVIAPCQELRDHPALRLRCTCGRGLDFLALASFATGVLVVSSPRRLPKKRRGGGTLDLAAVTGDDPEAGWALLPWEASMRNRSAAHKTAFESDPIQLVLGEGAGLIGDTAKRQTFICKGCGATHTFQNITLLRLLLRAIAAEEQEVRLAAR